jgi:hypothetical protein
MAWTVNAKDWVRNPPPRVFDGNNPTVLRTPAATVVAMSLGLTSPGRVGFFIDYSELSDAGVHTFYVCRTHGSTGAVSVDYFTGGDGHTSAMDTISWADGEMGTKSFTVEVTGAQLTNHQSTLGLGEHRIWAMLTNPTGGAGLQLGVDHTRAHGVIDNNVIATDANAVFYDSASATNGSGTAVSPYNNLLTAIANIGSARYLYGKGTTVVDNSFTNGSVNRIPFPATRTGEADRLYVRKWGLDTWTITGSVGIDSRGFFTDQGESYITYKGLAFTDLDGSGELGAIRTNYGGSSGIHVELCTFNNINATSNVAAFSAYGIDGAKMWRCVSDNVSVNGDNTSQNSAALVIHYQAKNISIQRCEASNSGGGIRLKRPQEADDSGVIRFCHFGTNLSSGIGAGFGTTTQGLNNLAVQYNIFELENFGAALSLGANSPNTYASNVISNNTFIGCGHGEVGAIYYTRLHSAQMYNNIFINCQKLWADYINTSAEVPDIEYADYNIHLGTISTNQAYEYQGINCVDAAAVQALRPDLTVNDVIADPLFTDAANGDYTLQPSSPALTGGVDGTQQGAYFGDFYTIGAN